MNKRLLCVMSVLCLSVFATVTCAVEVLWEEPVEVTSADILLVPNSGYVSAGSWGHSGLGSLTVEVGGETIVFYGTADPELSLNSGGGTHADVTAGGENGASDYFWGDTGSEAFNQVMQSFAWDGPNPKVLTLNGLTVGKGYHLQLFVSDERGCCSARSQLWSDQATRGEGNESATFTHQQSVCVMGSFVADAKTVTVYGHGVAQNQSLLNGYQLRAELDGGQASVVSPFDGENDVVRDEVVLEWIAGTWGAKHDVYLGIDFDDVNLATVDSAGIYQERVSETTYALGRLTLGETYYWRIDEVNEVDPNSPWKGAVWSFEVEPVGYPVAWDLVTASASGQTTDDQGAEKAADGSGINPDGQHGTDLNTMWLSDAAAPGEAWLQLDIDEPVKLAGLHVWNYNFQTEQLPIAGYSLGVKDVLIEISEDGQNWQSLGQVEIAKASGLATYMGVTVPMNGVLASSVKLTVMNGWGSIGQYGLSEVQLLAIPTAVCTMEPTNGSVVNPLDVELTWRAGREADVHELYLSTDQQAVINGTAPMVSVPDNDYTPVLDLGQTYYWKVNEVNAIETPEVWEGPVQSLTVVASIRVDNMESYADRDGLRAYETWEDGYYDDNNGSLTGHGDPGIAETDIVYEGSQSLPMEYGFGGAQDSFATWTFDQTEDWSKHSIKSLSLAVFGETTNVVGEFYVMVNDTVYVYEGVSSDLNAGQWMPFTINLKNATAVHRLTLGMKGGQGMLFIDDLRLYPWESEMVTPTTPADDGLLIAYPFEGDFRDASGNSHHGMALGEARIDSDSERGQVAFLDGFEDAIEVPAVDDVETFTVGLWVRLTDNDVTRFNNFYGTNGWEAGSLHLRYQNNRPIGDVWGLNVVVGTSPMKVDEWMHVGFSMDRTETTYTRAVYVNGVREAQVIQDVAPGNIYQAEIGNAVLGAWRNTSDVLERATMGYLDDVVMYDRALSLAEMAGLAERTTSYYKPF